MTVVLQNLPTSSSAKIFQHSSVAAFAFFCVCLLSAAWRKRERWKRRSHSAPDFFHLPGRIDAL